MCCRMRTVLSYQLDFLFSYMLKTILTFIIISYICILTSFAQQHKNQLEITSINEISEKVQSLLQEKGERQIQIYLIRHAKPKLHKRFLSSYSEAQEYIENYNRVSIYKIDSNQVVINLP